MRQEYLWGIVNVPNVAVVRASICELERVKREIGSRGELRRQEKEPMVKSVDDTLCYLRCLVEETNYPTSAEKETWEGDVRKTIGGVRELANYLGCGTSSAAAIAKGRKLVEAGVQYKVGRKWVFNKEGLDSLLKKHPEILRRYR